MLKKIQRRLTLILAVAALMCIGLCYTQGVRKGLDTRITYAFEHDAWSMSVGLSRLLFGLHEGYIGYKKVVDTTSSVLSPNGTHNPSSIHYLHDRSAIQQALDNVRQINPETLPPFNDGEARNFVSIYGEDVGLADFYTLAFAIFGLKADAMYKLYFLIFLLSAVLFVAEHRKLPVALFTLLAVCGTFTVFFFSTFFNSPLLPSVNANRFATSLLVIPLLHVLWRVSSKEKIGLRSAILLMLQALLFAFSVSIRKTGQAQLLLLFITMGVATRDIWWPQAHRFSLTALRSLIIYPPVASGLIFIGVYTSYGIIQHTQLNKLYFSDCSLPNHMTWHSLFLGLSKHPDWETYNTMSTPGTKGDNIAWSAFEKYMKDRNEEYTCPQTGARHKLRIHEQVIRKYYLEFVMHHPKYMFELQSYYKPLLFFNYTKNLISGVELGFWYVMAISSILTGICFAWFITIPGQSIRRILIIPAISLLLFSLPPMLAYPNALMSDILWMLVINVFLWIWALTYRVAKICGPVLNPNYLQIPKAPKSILQETVNTDTSRRSRPKILRTVLLALTLLSLGFCAGRMSVFKIEPENRIRVSSATYGKSCDAVNGNVTEPLSASCNGRDKCHYRIDVNLLGDPAPQCGKDFEAVWTCGSNSEPNRLHVSAEAGLGKIALLSCPPLQLGKSL